MRPVGALSLVTGVLVASTLLLTPLALPQLQQRLRRCMPPIADAVAASQLYRQHATGSWIGAAGGAKVQHAELQAHVQGGYSLGFTAIVCLAPALGNAHCA